MATAATKERARRTTARKAQEPFEKLDDGFLQGFRDRQAFAKQDPQWAADMQAYRDEVEANVKSSFCANRKGTEKGAR
jgi:hypothetical protein